MAQELFGKSIPLVSVGSEGFAELERYAGNLVAVEGASVVLDGAELAGAAAASTPEELLAASSLVLSAEERAMLEGDPAVLQIDLLVGLS